MPNGRNAGRLFSDCTNEHGHGEWHSFTKEPEVGETVTCTNCKAKFIVAPDGKLARVNWASGPSFAEIAEVLKVPTDHIMAMHQQGETFIVLYTPVLPDDLDLMTDEPEVYSASVKRDADGIPVVFGEPELRPGMWANIRAQMEEGLG